MIRPDSVYHVTQLEVLFEDTHFHFRTRRVVQILRASGFLSEREVSFHGTTATIVWRSNVRYVERAIAAHSRLMSEYSSETMNKATGDYAEILVPLGLARLHLDVIDRNARSYRNKIWTETGHDLDFIVEKDDVGYGVEVKNTWIYIPFDELNVKLKMCKFLGIRPLFIVRHRHEGQWRLVQQEQGMLYIFKSKIFPPGHIDLTRSIWEEMRLPVIIWNDLRPNFYTVVGNFITHQ